MLHFCVTRDGEHTSLPSLYVMEPQLSPLATALINGLPEDPRYRASLARAYFSAIVHHLEYNLAQQRTPKEAVQTKVLSPDHLARPAWEHDPVQRAREYIETHFREPLTLDKIASHAYVSSTHLNRLFQARFKMTAMGYLTRHRIRQAKVLLEETTMSAQYIGVLVGYPTQESFNRIFKRYEGSTSGAYRRMRSS